MESYKFHFHEKIASLDKKVVIIDIGKRYTKLGFSGETHPRCIIPTVIRDAVTEKQKNVLDYCDTTQLYDNFVEFLHYLYFKSILISPKDTKVVVVESLLAPSVIRETLAKVLFCHLQISSLLLVPSHMVALYTLAINTALVLDIGHEEATLIPVYEGYPVLHAYQAFPLAGAAVEANVKKLLLESSDEGKQEIVENLPNKTIEDIKVRLCFVTTLARSQQVPPPQPAPSSSYPLAGSESLAVPGSVRETAWEVVFQLDSDNVSLQTMILDSLLKCPVDMRRPLSQNILLLGGSAATPGLKSRLLDELRYHVKTPRYADRLFVSEFKMHTAPCHENCTAWLGGSLAGASEMVNMQAVSIEEYKREGDVPDWASLKYNLKQDIPSK